MARTYNSGWREWFNTSHNLQQELSDGFVVEGLTELSKKLDALMVKNPEMEQKIQKIITKALQMVRANVSDEYKAKLDNDPREAYRAVRRTVYRRILGGNVNILRNKRAGTPTSYTPTRTLKSGQRGGNRMVRSERTYRMESYGGKDRGFILRFLEDGTRSRKIKGFNVDNHRSQVVRGKQGGDLNKYGKTVNTGRRGAITGRHIFSQVAEHYMDNSIEFIESEVDKLIDAEFA